MSIKKALKSLSLLWLGSVIGSGSTFVIYTILAREIGPASFGLFSSAMATITIFSLLAGFGVPQVWLKLFGKEGWNALRWVNPSLRFVGITLLLVSLAILLLTLVQTNDEVTNNLLLLLLFYIYGYIAIQLVASKLQLEERYVFLSFWQLLPNLSRLLLVVAGYYVLNYKLTVLDVGIIYAGVGLFFALIAGFELIKLLRGNVVLKGHRKELSEKLSVPKIKEVFKEAWPFGFAGVFAFIYIQSDIIMVKYMTGDAEAGYYNVAYTIMAAIMTIPIIVFSKFLIPKYHRWSNHDQQKFYNTYKKGNKYMLVAGTIIMILVWLLAQFFIPLLFGELYNSSISLLNILAATIPFSFLAYSYGASLLTSEHMRIKVKLMGLVALFNVILNLFLIMKYGAIGAASSTVLSNILLALMYRHKARTKVFKLN